MAIVLTKLTLSLTKQTVKRTIEMPQGDTGRGLDIFLSNDIITSESGTSDSSLQATLYGKKPSGKIVSFNASQVNTYSNGNAYEMIFDSSTAMPQLLAEAGECDCNVVLTQNGITVTSFEFGINVTSSVAMNDTFTSNEVYQNLIEALNAFNSAKDQLDEYVKEFEAQAKLTVNVRYGMSNPSVLSTDKDGDLYIKIGS